MSFRRVVSYPVRGDHAETAVVSGVALSFLLAGLLRVGVVAAPVAAAVWVALVGYAVRVLAASADGDPEPPGFGDPTGLLATGVRGTALLAAYGSVPIAALAGGEVVLAGLLGAGTNGVAPYVALVVSVGTLSVVLSFGYLLPAALARAGRAGSLRAGLPSRSLVTSVRRVEYLVAWTAAAVLLVAVAALASALFSVSHPAANVLAVPLSFYGAVVGARVAGRGLAGRR